MTYVYETLMSQSVCPGIGTPLWLRSAASVYSRACRLRRLAPPRAPSPPRATFRASSRAYRRCRARALVAS